MKASSFVIGCFAAFGIYFSFTAVAELISVTVLLHQIGMGDVIGLTEAILGVVCLIYAAPLGRLVCRFGGIGDEQFGPLDRMNALLLGCVVTGLVTIFRQIPEVVRLSYVHWVGGINPRLVDFNPWGNGADQLLGALVNLACALVLVLKAKTIAAALNARYERGDRPAGETLKAPGQHQA